MSKRAGKLAKRYARALLRGLAGDLTTARQLADALNAFADKFFAQRELVISILSPMFDRNERGAALLAVAQSTGLPKTGVDFLRTLFERDRLVNLREIAAAFRELADAAANVIPVEVVTAQEISKTEADEIASSVAKTLRGTPLFHWSVDPTIIGGMVIKHSGRVVDGSLRGRLERLEQELIEKSGN
jgi:F-type H+-transporting ATPase subunit delta